MASRKSNLQDFADPGIHKGMVCGMAEFIDCILQRTRIVKISAFHISNNILLYHAKKVIMLQSFPQASKTEQGILTL